MYNSFLERRSRDPEIRDPIKVFNLSGHACSEVSFFTSFLVMHADQKTRVRKSTRNIYTTKTWMCPITNLQVAFCCTWLCASQKHSTVLHPPPGPFRRGSQVSQNLILSNPDKTWDCRRFCPFRVAWHLAPSSGSGVLRPIRASSLYTWKLSNERNIYHIDRLE